MASFELSWTVEKDSNGKLLKQFLREEGISKTALTQIKFGGGSIFVNEVIETVRYILKEQDIVRIVFPAEAPSDGLICQNIPFSIVSEDSYVMVVDKKAGMSTIPSREHPDGSLANAIVGHYKNIGLQSTVHIVTRLDRDTSGLVLIAKHSHVHHLLSKQQKKHEIKRTYEALAEGVFLEDQGIIEEPIGRKADSIIEREVRSDGAFARTRYTIKTRYKEFSHVQLMLDTGRTHQIRVHLSFLGHPLLGDDLYGGGMEKMDRQALHCSHLTFYHPFEDRILSFSSSLPDDIKRILLHGSKRQF
ncbi:RluA family pseudouridine synthase [Cytobacillus gottheilii]|uniref:RluA family pseudouridine synthase n=1 Tax=Cytobacillus gottheilii TaxID=859144 RepID=UPI0009BBC531|nr:RluA family pseudouridine synthase [Cytobacillus gottheilii]